MRILLYLLLLFLSPLSLSAQWDSSFTNTYYEQKKSLFKLLPDEDGEIIFLGNSITDIGEWSEIWQNCKVKNRGISSDITFGILDRLDEVLSSKPAIVFLLIGINDIARNIPDTIILQNFKRIINRVQQESPGTRLVIQSILPVNNEFPVFVNHFNKDDRIKNVNAGLRKLCSASSFLYINLHDAFLDSDKKLDKLYTNDGLHLNGNGFMKWKCEIEKLKLF